MLLTVRNRLKLCWEILTIRSGHAHTAQEKSLSTFERGYDAGRIDERYEAPYTKAKIEAAVLRRLAGKWYDGPVRHCKTVELLSAEADAIERGEG